MAVNCLLLFGTIVFFSCADGLTIGDRCRYDSDCFVEQSYCYRQEICECKENFLPTSDLQYCVATVGAICNSRHDCSTLENSVCIEERCLCSRGFVPDPHNAACKPAAQGVNSDCDFDAQCQHVLGDFATCVKRRCQCLPNYHFQGTCVRSRSLGDACTKHSDCFGNFTQCSAEHRCSCRPGYLATTQGICKSSGNSPGVAILLLISTSFYTLVFSNKNRKNQ